ncbi:MAG: hypothetical protein JWQ87_2106 [Candidatus Sulfotelmatobacter sp.]|nr:hypothetical protein [Candidatus Sulfotelmatobacter sp.]
MVPAGSLVRSDPHGWELRKSRRNRRALHGDFHGGEANVFTNYAFETVDAWIMPRERPRRD